MSELERFVYVNGRVASAGDAAIRVTDRGLLYGDGLFETFRVVGGKPVLWRQHLERLAAGALALAIDNLPDRTEIEAAIAAVLEANALTDARVRLTITRGESAAPGLASGTTGQPTVILTADPLPSKRPEPARVVISSVRRDERSPLSAVKSLNYLPGILAVHEAQRAGADDAILLNIAGNVAEGTIGNLFLVMGDTLVTPSLDQGLLPGTVRAVVIELAPGLGLSVSERPVAPREVTEADEAFFTNAIGLVRPIREVDGARIGSGENPVAERTRQAVLAPAAQSST